MPHACLGIDSVCLAVVSGDLLVDEGDEVLADGGGKDGRESHLAESLVGVLVVED